MVKTRLKLIMTKFHPASKSISSWWEFRFTDGDTLMTLCGTSANDYNADDYLVVEMSVVVQPHQQTLNDIKSD
jgi:hypothetical protein